MATLEENVAEIARISRQIKRLKEKKEELDELVIAEVGEGCKREFADGTKVSVTRHIVKERFDAKRYLKEHPDAADGYMVASTRKASVLVTLPKGDEW